MAIKILPQGEIKQAANLFSAPPVLFANPKNLYFRRAKRLRQLAEDNPFADYLNFAANLVDVQLSLLESHSLSDHSEKINTSIKNTQGEYPLNVKYFKRSDEWRTLLMELLTRFKPYANDTTLATIEFLEKSSNAELEQYADKLLNNHFNAVEADKSVFLWAALSLYWSQLTQQLPRNIEVDSQINTHTCPVCNSAPTASIVHFGDKQGLRYLHCSLCESEWYMIRVQCSNCEQKDKLDYWSLNEIKAAIKAESCGHCDSYLKILYQDQNHNIEAIADDLASIFLDAEMEEKGLFRSGLNPFMFPAK